PRRKEAAMPFTEDLHTEIELEAGTDEVWQTLTRFEDFPAWNPFIVSVQGSPRVGAKLVVRLEPPGGRGATLHPTVREAEPGRVLAWLGRIGFPGVFDAAHRFELSRIDAGRTRFVQS